MASKKILIADDSKLVHKVYEAILGDGFEFLHAYDGVEAMVLLSEHRDVSLILLDLGMPKLNGFELLRRIRSSPLASTIPVIVISAEQALMGSIERLSGGAAVSYLPKPVRPEALRDAVDRLGIDLPAPSSRSFRNAPSAPPRSEPRPPDSHGPRSERRPPDSHVPRSRSGK